MKHRGYTPPDLPEEEAIIEGEDGGNKLSDLQFRLYRLLKRSMDRHTCISGLRSRVSYAGLRQRAYQESRRGFAGTGTEWGDTPRKQNEYIRNQVSVLEQRGLIKRTLLNGGFLSVEFVIFKQFRDVYFSDQNKLSAKSPHFAPPIPPQSHADNSSNNSDFGEVNFNSVRSTPRTENAKPSAYPEVSRSKDTTTTAPGDAWKSDPLAAAMLAGGMQEYVVGTQLSVISQWRSMEGFDEEMVIRAIQARLAKNHSVNSLSYFSKMVMDLSAKGKRRKVIPFRAADTAGNQAGELVATNPEEAAWL